MQKIGIQSQIPKVFVIVPVHNRRQKTLHFIRQFKDVVYPEKSIVVVDDGSTDGTGEEIRRLFPEVVVLNGNGDLWWSGATNLGIKYALENGADYILTINDDATMESNFLTRMVELASIEKKSIIGCRIHRQDDPARIWALGATAVFSKGELYRLNYYDELWSNLKDVLEDTFPVDTMPGNGVLLPVNVFKEVGFYDEKWMPQYYADSDFVMRAAKKGYRPLISLESVLYNHRSTELLANNKRELIFSKKSGFYWRTIICALFRHGSRVRFIPEVFLNYKMGFQTLPRPEVPMVGFKGIKEAMKTVPVIGTHLVLVWRLIKDFKQRYKEIREELSANSCNIDQIQQQEAEPARNYSELTIEQIQQELNKRFKNGKNAYSSPTLWDDVRDEELNKQFIDMISPTNGKKILELGCGIDGSAPYISACDEYIGTDLSTEAINTASKTFGNRSGFSFVVMDAQDLKFPDCTFDLVIAREVIEHVPDIKRILQEVFRVLKPGGNIVITSPNRDSLHLRVNRMLGHKDFTCSFDHIKELTYGEAEKLLLEVGFKITNTSGLFLKPYWGIPGVDEHVRHLTDNDPVMVDMLKELGRRCGPEYAFGYLIKAERPNNG